MKTEAEIRKYIDDLLVALQVPCNCMEEDHEPECYMGGLMIKATIANLRWVVGENAENDRVVENLSARAERFRAGF